MTGAFTHGSESILHRGRGPDHHPAGRTVRRRSPIPSPSPRRRRPLRPSAAGGRGPAVPVLPRRAKGTPLGATVTEKLARAMVVEARRRRATSRPATPTSASSSTTTSPWTTPSVMLGEDVSPGRAAPGPVAQPRPRLAVRRRAERPGSAKFYEADGLHLKTGTTIRGRRPTGPRRATTCRGSARANKATKRTALIPDPRNDENLIVAQTHLAMIRFHNRVVDRLPRRRCRRRRSSAGPASW